jgi:catechol 2,3-dioxygenase-like lactoylglutathione lyase family enzyme
VSILGGAPLMAFIPVSDIEAARQFCSTTLGLHVVEDSPFALVVPAAGTTLRITPVDHLRPQPSTVAGWMVDDIGATADALSDTGIPCLRYPGMAQDGRGIWTAPDGDRVAWFDDPYANTLSITQFVPA